MQPLGNSVSLMSGVISTMGIAALNGLLQKMQLFHASDTENYILNLESRLIRYIHIQICLPRNCDSVREPKF